MKSSRFRVQSERKISDFTHKVCSCNYAFCRVQVHQSQRQLLLVVCTYSIHTSAMHTFVNRNVCARFYSYIHTVPYVGHTGGRLAVARSVISPVLVGFYNRGGEKKKKKVRLVTGTRPTWPQLLICLHAWISHQWRDAQPVLKRVFAPLVFGWI